MKYSILFLEYDPQGINRKTTIDSLQSVVEHSKDYDFELIHIKNVKGFVNAVNDGLARSRGEYIVMVANDVIIKDYKWLDKLTVKDAIVGWRLTTFFLTGESRPDFACWGISREVFEKVGFMDKQFEEGYGFDDDDYIFRCKDAGFNVKDGAVELEHRECMTYLTVFKPDKEGMTARNQSLFINKWNHKLKLQ